MNRIIADWAPFAGCPQSLAFGDRGLIPAVLTTTEKASSKLAFSAHQLLRRLRGLSAQRDNLEIDLGQASLCHG
jgi:hypothetical protein